MTLIPNMHRSEIEAGNLMRILTAVAMEYGGPERTLTVSQRSAMVDLRDMALDVFADLPGKLTIRVREMGKPRVPEIEVALPEETAPPCGCGHEKARHVAGVGRCGEGSCSCEGYR